MDVLFLDANILFSAAYRSDNGLLRLWLLSRKGQVRLVSSRYAVEEVRRNLSLPVQQARLRKLLHPVRLVEASPADLSTLPPSIPAKDRPILAAAIAAGATHLLTGDLKHFSPHFGRRIGNVLILPPSRYLRQRRRQAASTS